MEKPPVLLIPAVLNRQDPSIVLAAVSQDPSAIEFASQSLVSQQDFLCLGALGWFFQWGFLKSWGFPKHEGVYFMENHMKILWRFIYWCLCHGKSYENHWKWIWFRGTPPHFRTPPLFLILSGKFKVCELENHHLIFNQLSHHVCHRTGPWLHSYVK